MLLAAIPFVAEAQCPVLEGAMVNSCGTSEGLNEFFVFSTTTSAPVSAYTLYYGSNNPPSSSPTAYMSGADATASSGAAIVTTTGGTIVEITSPTTTIPANSRVLFIPSDFNNSYDLSNLANGGTVYVVYINRNGSHTSWATNGNFANNPSGTRYLSLVYNSGYCSEVVSYNSSNLVSKADGDFVSWTASGASTGSNNGCTSIPPVCTPPTITTDLSTTAATYCQSKAAAQLSVIVSSTATYQWYVNTTNSTSGGSAISGATSASYTPPTATVGTQYYYVVATNADCSTTSSITPVTIKAIPTASISSNNSPVCSGSAATFTLSGTPSATVTYQLNSGTAQTTTLNASGTGNISVSGATTDQTLTLQSVSNGSCSQSLSASSTVTVNTKPAFGSPTTSCSSSLSTYTVTVSVNAGTVTATSGTVSNPSGTTWSISGISATSNVTLTATNSTCITTLAVTAPNCNCPAMTAPTSGGNKTYCSGNTRPSVGATPVGSDEVIDWYDALTGGTLLASASNTYSPTASGTYYAQARNITTGCTSARTAVIVTENATPTLSTIQSVCTGYTLSITANTAGGTWSSSNTTVGTVSSGTLTALSAGTVTVTYTASNGCATTTSINVSDMPTAAIAYASPSYCSNVTSVQAAGLTGTGAYTGGTYAATPVGLSLDASTGAISPAQSTPGTYTVTYSLGTGCGTCQATTEVTITKLPTAIITYIGTPYYVDQYIPQVVTLTGDEGGIFSAPSGLAVDNGSGAITPSDSKIGAYLVTYTIPAAGGCPKVTATTEVEIDKTIPPIFIPGGFSPNGDGANDYFVILNIDQYPHNKITICNRWGNKVYEASPYANQWDGRSYFGLKLGSESNLPVGVYFYVLDLGDGYGVRKGSVFLNR